MQAGTFGGLFRQRLKDSLIALSLANLCFMSAWFRLLYGSELGYFKKPVSEASLLAMAANILWLAVVLWIALRALRRFQNPWFHRVSHLVFFGLLLLPLDFCRRQVFHMRPQDLTTFLKRPVVGLGLLALGVLVLWQHRRVTRIAAIAVGLLSPLALFTFARILLVSLNVAHLAEPTSEPALAPMNPVAAGGPRVIWIIFDETDFRVTFDERPPKVHLPEFDRLRHNSIFATNAYPPADGTIMSMPALISGQRLTNVATKGVSDLELTLGQNGHTALWSQTPSVFGAARALGFNTALIGWFHPYRRILARDLNFCDWYPYPGDFPQQQRTFGAALVSQMGCLAGGLQFERLFGRVCQAMISESVNLVTNANYGLILLHLPPPHHPGVYLPDEDRFSIRSQPQVQGYFNNLVLADRSLGKLRRALESAGQWDQAWIILSADHSWRRSRLYDGRRDLRVPFLMKAPGAKKETVLSSQINTVLTRDLIVAILRRQITNQQTAGKWLGAHASGESPAATETTDPLE
jgi:hypothetical protein